MKWTAITLAAFALSACALPNGPSLAGHDGLSTKVTWFYRAHATEEGGRCKAPEIKGITQTKVVEETDEQLILRLRYSYLDSAFRNDRRTALIGNCEGFATRDFTIAKNQDKLVVASMSGAVR